MMRQRTTRRTLVGAAALGVALAGSPMPGGARQDDAATPGSDATSEGTSMEAPTNDEMKALWERWAALWNGDLAIAGEIVAPEFVAHYAPAANSPSEVRGPDGLAGWIEQIMANYTGYSVTTTVGPLAEGTLLAGRWVIRGTYQGGIPGSVPEAVGREIAFEGMDLLRVEGGRLVEYWVSSDTLHLLQQVGVIPS